LTEVATQKAE